MTTPELLTRHPLPWRVDLRAHRNHAQVVQIYDADGRAVCEVAESSVAQDVARAVCAAVNGRD
jgi:hypothetical protein